MTRIVHLGAKRSEATPAARFETGSAGSLNYHYAIGSRIVFNAPEDLFLDVVRRSPPGIA